MSYWNDINNNECNHSHSCYDGKCVSEKELVSAKNDIIATTKEYADGLQEEYKTIVDGELENFETDLTAYGTRITNNENNIADLKVFVTPGMFGAVGDGVTDDTEAWQEAVDSGYNVISDKKSYKIGKITVTENIVIDCGNSSFIAIDNELFVFNGTIDNTFTDEDYTIDNDYNITNETYNSYNGMAVLKGDNSLDMSRNYYKGGFVCFFENGNITNHYPCDVTNTNIELVTPITATIKNISNITHSVNADTGSTYSIRFNYGYNCKVENINARNNGAYTTISFNYCYCCCVDKFTCRNTATNTTGNSYPVAFLNSSFCKCTNSDIYNKNWHATTTGGNYLCFNNMIENCIIVSDTQYAHGDHENAYDTVIKDCYCKFGVDIANSGLIDNLTINYANTTQKHCLIRLAIGNNENYNNFSINNVTYNGHPDCNASYIGIMIGTTSGTGYVASTKYLDKLSCNNIKTNNMGTKQPQIVYSCLTTDTIIIGDIYMNNSDIAIAGYAPISTQYSYKETSLFSFINSHKWNGTNSYLLLNASRYIKRLYLNNVTVQGVSGDIDYLTFGSVRFYSAFGVKTKYLFEGDSLKRITGGAVALFPETTCVVNIDKLSYSGQLSKYNVHKANSGTTLRGWLYVNDKITYYKNEVGTTTWAEFTPTFSN